MPEMGHQEPDDSHESQAPLDADEITPAGTGFPIVGIGASAGGLEAFNTFFDHMPPDSGVAFVLLMHLIPDRESQAAELIQRHTAMPVRPAEDGLRVEPNHVYVIQPNTTLTIDDGVLYANALGQRMVVDAFFCSLAEAQGRNAVCIVLSGTGSDGTKGLKAIKEHGGVAMTQVGARYDDMPRNAHAAGMGDYELPVEDMPARLLEYAAHIGQVDNQKVIDGLRQNGRTQLGRILTMLRAQTGHDFSDYKETTVIRRIERRMQVTQSSSAEQYVELLRTSPAELGFLFNDLLIGVTQFMRDGAVFQALSKHVVPEICASKGSGERVRVWVPGCATGEEAYSLAILFQEEMTRSECNVRLQVFATDISERALGAARAGIYPRLIAEYLSVEQLERYFWMLDHAYQIAKPVRELCIFAKHDLLRDPPFSRVDMISCRNVLIYLTPAVQQQLIPLFHYALKPGGVLLLGPSETIGGYGNLFAPIDRKQRVFRRLDAATPRLDLPMGRGVRLLRDEERQVLPPGPDQADINRQAERYVLDEYAPPYVVVNGRYEVIYFSGGTGPYIEPPPGAPDRSILNMARRGLHMHLRATLDQAMQTKEPVARGPLHVKTNGEYQTIILKVRPMSRHGDPTDYYTVIFEPTGARTDPPQSQALTPLAEAEEHSLAQQLEEELHSTRRHLQTTIEELEASNEALKSANEELMSTNEELQSTAEELDTSKEELQSVNEELTFANEELHRNNDELTRANSDIKNLFDNAQIAMIFLDQQLTIRMHTPRMTDLYHLQRSDTGRAISHIRPKHDYADLEADVARVLKSSSPVEHNVRTPDSEFIMRILPYQTLENGIDGVVVTFVEITSLTRAHAEIEQLLEARALRAGELEAMLTMLPVGVLICNDAQARQVRTNNLGAEILGVAEDLEISGRDKPVPFKLIRDGATLTRSEFPLQRVLVTNEPVSQEMLRLERADGGMREIEVSARPVLDERGKMRGAVGVFSDVTERNREYELQAARQSALVELGLFALSESDMTLAQLHVIERLCKVLDTARCEVWRLDAANHQVSVVARVGGARDLPQEHTIGADAGNLVGYALVSEATVVVENAATEKRFAYPTHLERLGMVRSMAAAIRHDGSLWGVLCVHDDRGGKFLPYDANFLQSVARLLGGVLRRKQLEIGHGEREREQALKEAEDRLRQAERLASLGTLAAGIAHEVNNPLNAILMNAELGVVSLTQPKLQERLAHLLETIIKEAKRGGAITRNVLQFSRADRFTPKGLADLNNLIGRVREHVALVLHKHDARLDLDLDQELPRIELNQIAMEQALVNLISNAAQSGATRVTLKTDRENKHVRVIISDDGDGISQEQIEHIFDPFYTTRRSEGGSGLGLSLVHRIVSDHDGTIEAQSRNGGGARFVMRLPLPQGRGEPTPAPT